MNRAIDDNRPGEKKANRPGGSRPTPGSWIMVGIAWLLVSVPPAWGVFKVFEKATILFRG